MKKVLFSTAWGPFTEQFFNTSPTDVMNQRFSRGCDIFSMGGHLHMNALHLLAQNISIPSIILEYPRKKDFIKEINKGYDYIGLSVFHNQVNDLVEMCNTIRSNAPETIIVIGGFGARGLMETMGAEELSKLCDYACHGEGIRFFRKLLGEDPNAKMFHSHLPKWGYTLPMISRNSTGATPVVVGSLGCPNGCDFCGTTEMFHQKRIEIMSPEQVHKEFKRAWRADSETIQGVLLEEDTFQNIEYITELGRLLREDSEFGLAYYNFYCLSSIRSMSQWSFEDMMLTGCANVFVGMESKFASEQGYGKRDGRSAKEVFDGLHSVGITTTGAWMAGFDFQNRNNIEEDLQEFINLCPTMQQLTRVCPFPATPMWEQLLEQKRIKEEVNWEDVSFYGGGGMELKNFHDHEIMEIIERGYRQLYETHGSCLARIAGVNIQGYEYCKENKGKNKFFMERAQFYKRFVMTIYPLLKAMEIYAPNNIVRKTMKDLRRKYFKVIGKPTLYQETMEKAVTGVSGITKFLDVLYPRENIISEEPFKKYIYEKPAPPYPECPYSVDYPYRTINYSLEKKIRNGVRKIMNGAELFSKPFDMMRGVKYDQSMEAGTFKFYL